MATFRILGARGVRVVYVGDTLGKPSGTDFQKKRASKIQKSKNQRKNSESPPDQELEAQLSARMLQTLVWYRQAS